MRPITRAAAIYVTMAAASACSTTALNNAHVRGTVVVDQKHDRYHGAPIRIAFHTQEADTKTPCHDNWSDCLSASVWTDLESCSVKAAKDATKLRITVGESEHGFDACTGTIAPGTTVDVVAFIDLDDDGELSDGEPHGVRHGGEIGEFGLASLTIAIDRAGDTGVATNTTTVTRY
jgi:hypothetical protein